MSKLANIFAGGEVIADDLRNVAPLSAAKTSDESVTTLTLHNDNALWITVTADTNYQFKAIIFYEGGTQGASDFKMGWSVPVATTMSWTRTGLNSAGAVTVSTFATETDTPAVGTNGSGSVRSVILEGTISTSTAPGTVQFQWCTNTTPAVATIVHARSTLVAWEL